MSEEYIADIENNGTEVDVEQEILDIETDANAELVDIEVLSNEDSVAVELADDAEVSLSDEVVVRGGTGVTSYNDLTDKPSINGITLVGNINIDGDKHYTHTQTIPSDTWEVTHNLGKYPSVEVVDSAGSVVVGDYKNIDTNTMLLTFSGAFAGKAYFN